MRKKQNKIVFYTIKGSTIKKFIVLDLITGTGIYYVFKIIFASVLVATVGSFVVPEAIKKHKPKKIVTVKRQISKSVLDDYTTNSPPKPKQDRKAISHI